MIMRFYFNSKKIRKCLVCQGLLTRDCFHFRYRGILFHLEPTINNGIFEPHYLKVYLWSKDNIKELIPIYNFRYISGGPFSFYVDDTEIVELSPDVNVQYQFQFDHDDFPIRESCHAQDIRVALDNVITKYPIGMHVLFFI